jgi:hypothetical protein
MSQPSKKSDAKPNGSGGELQLEDEIDRLYSLPLDQFTVARDGLAKQLRRDGSRAQADGVKALRKPSIAAWALNQLRRRDADAVNRLIAAGERLREAQERLLASGDRGALRGAAEEERRLVDELARAGERQLEDAGQQASGATKTRLWSTLRAIAGDPEARELLASGRLVLDYEISDLGLGVGPAPSGPVAKLQSPAKPSPDAKVEQKVRGLERKLERARERRGDTEAQLADAEQLVQEARRDASRAATRLERAEATAGRTRAKARDASDLVTELEGALRAILAERG